MTGQGGEPPSWLVTLLKEPEKVLRRLPRDLREDIDSRLTALARDPRPEACTAPKGSRLYRIKARHDWRIIYGVDDERHEVIVAEIGLRGSVYRDL